MAYDLKYGQVTAERGDSTHGGKKSGTGVPLNKSDEPCFVLRAQDRLSISTLEAYRDEADDSGATEEFLSSIDNVIGAFAYWQDAHADSVKQPD